MTDLQDAIVAAIEEDADQRGTPHELRARVNDRGIDASADEIALACDDLVQAGELKVVGEREDSKLYERLKGARES